MADDQTRDKYLILLEETRGYTFWPDVVKAPKTVWKPVKLQRGTILEEIEEQPSPHKKTFVVADRRAGCKDAYFDCFDFDYDSADKLMITDGEAKRLLKIASLEERYESFRQRQRSSSEDTSSEVS